MKFSLVVATHNRVEQLDRFLHSLLAQDDNDFEVIIADQNSDDRLVDVVNTYQSHFPITHLKRVKLGTSHARNQGSLLATGDIIAFPDDDCLYPLGFLTKVADFFASDPTWDGLSVSIRALEGDEDAFEYSVQESQKIDSRPIAARVGIGPGLIFRADLAKKIAFDEEMGPGARWVGGEDTDYLFRCLSSGAAIYYSYELFVRHPKPYETYTIRQLMRREFTYGRGLGYLMRKHDSVRSMVWQQLFVVPIKLTITYALAGDFRHALPCPGMGIGRILGYWEGMKYIKESKSHETQIYPD